MYDIYPPNYKVIDNCLYEIRNSKQGPYDKKLCNFVPRLVREISEDNGAQVSTRIVLSGVHADGRTLPEIEIGTDELAGFGWLNNCWGIDCIPEPGPTVRESIRYAIQTTAAKIERTRVYTVTGWKKINGRWEYLMPGDPALTVRLPDKMQGYTMARRCEAADMAAAYALLVSRVAPPEILFPMMAFVFLTPLNHFLKLAGHEPRFVFFLVGRTGSRKSTLAALFLSFFGLFNGANLPMSFQDTANSIIQHLFSLKDVLTCVDDFHPAGRRTEKVMNDIVQRILRSVGERTGRSRLCADSTPMAARPPQGNVLLTGEFPPDVGESGTARYFSLELGANSVDLEELSQVQALAEDGALCRCMYGYIQWLKVTCLTDADTEERFIFSLKERFERYRQDFYSANRTTHGRVAETAAWLRLGMDLFLSFLKTNQIIHKEQYDFLRQQFQEILDQLAAQQAANIIQDKPTHKFIRTLNVLLESERVCVLNKDSAPAGLPQNCVGYEDNDYYYLLSEVAENAVRKFCNEQNEDFTLKHTSLLRQLAEEKLIDVGKDQKTRAVRCGGKTRRVLCLKKDAIQSILDGDR